MQRKLADRELEIEMDNRDRQKEKEELEELKAKIYSSDSNNPEFEFAKVVTSRWSDTLQQKRVACNNKKKYKRMEKMKESWHILL